MDQKNEIFEKAVILFSSKGYENVTMKDIATAVGINPAGIYNYFNSKNAILKAVYCRYSEVIHAERPTPEEYMPILETGTAEEILNIFNYGLPEPLDINFSVIRIVLTRKSSDEKAMQIYLKSQWVEARRYLDEVFAKATEIGRLMMSDTALENFKHLLLATREHSANMATMIPDRMEWRRIETGMNQYLAALLAVHEPKVPPQAKLSPANISAALVEAIEWESLAVGRYYHYSMVLKRMGKAGLSHFVDEIIENILDELDSLYNCRDQTWRMADPNVIMRLIADHEVYKRLNFETNGHLSDVFSQIAELALQHERICRSHIEQDIGADN